VGNSTGPPCAIFPARTDPVAPAPLELSATHETAPKLATATRPGPRTHPAASVAPAAKRVAAVRAARGYRPKTERCPAATPPSPDGGQGKRALCPRPALPARSAARRPPPPRPLPLASSGKPGP